METFGPVLSIFLLIFVGAALRRANLLRQSDAQVVNTVIIYATVPALAFGICYGRKLTWEIGAVVLLGLAALLINLVASRGVARLLKLNRPQTGAFMVMSSFGNTTFLGIPVLAAAFHNSPQALLIGIIYSEFATALPVYTLGLWIASKYGGTHARIHDLFSPKRLPAIPAMAAGLLLSSAALPKPFLDATHYLGAATIPLAMISVGLMLSARSFKGNEWPIVLAGVLKLVCLPAMLYAILTVCGIQGISRQTVVLQAGMPTSVIASVMTARGGSDGPLVASGTLVLTLASLITIPIVVTLIR